LDVVTNGGRKEGRNRAMREEEKTEGRAEGEGNERVK